MSAEPDMQEPREISALYTTGLPPRLRRLKRLIEDAARRALRERGARAHALSITFVGDRKMREINRKAFGRRGTTDVVAFDLSEKGLPCGTVGDIYVSLDRARENSRRFRVSEREEIIRLVVHGVLHIIGFRDDDATLGCEMKAHQERIVSGLSRGHKQARLRNKRVG